MATDAEVEAVHAVSEDWRGGVEGGAGGLGCEHARRSVHGDLNGAALTRMPLRAYACAQPIDVYDPYMSEGEDCTAAVSEEASAGAITVFAERQRPTPMISQASLPPSHPPSPSPRSSLCPRIMICDSMG